MPRTLTPTVRRPSATRRSRSRSYDDSWSTATGARAGRGKSSRSKPGRGRLSRLSATMPALATTVTTAVDRRMNWRRLMPLICAPQRALTAAGRRERSPADARACCRESGSETPFRAQRGSRTSSPPGAVRSRARPLGEGETAGLVAPADRRKRRPGVTSEAAHPAAPSVRLPLSARSRCRSTPLTLVLP